MAITSEAITKAIESPDYILEVNMPLHSKARPRMTKTGHTYMAQEYRIAQAKMRRELEQQWPHLALTGPIAIYVKLYGEARGDADNLVGFLLDAAGPSGKRPGLLWQDDRVSIIPVLLVEWEKVTKAESKWVIHIALL